MMKKERVGTRVRELPTESLMLTVSGVAILLGCSPKTVYRLADQGGIPQPVRLGGLVRWPKVKFEKWIDEGCPALKG